MISLGFLTGWWTQNGAVMILLKEVPEYCVCHASPDAMGVEDQTPVGERMAYGYKKGRK